MSDMLSHHISIHYGKACILLSREESLGLAILQGEEITHGPKYQEVKITETILEVCLSHFSSQTGL